jgi:hypothetical protein
MRECVGKHCLGMGCMEEQFLEPGFASAWEFLSFILQFK